MNKNISQGELLRRKKQSEKQKTRNEYIARIMEPVTNIPIKDILDEDKRDPSEEGGSHE